MGLEIAEFVIAVEEEFQVDIMEGDAQNIDTLGDLVDYLERETARSPHSQAEADRVFREGFLSVQRYFAKELGVEPAQLTPETEVAPLLKSSTLRRRFWKKMRKEISAAIPSLYGKTYLEWGGGVCVFIGFFVFLFTVIELERTVWFPVKLLYGIIAGAVTGIVLFIMGIFVFLPFFSTIPKECRSLGGIARHAVRSKVSLDPHGQVWTRETITPAVLRIAGEQSGIPVEKISLTERFVELF